MQAYPGESIEKVTSSQSDPAIKTAVLADELYQDKQAESAFSKAVFNSFGRSAHSEQLPALALLNEHGLSVRSKEANPFTSTLKHNDCINAERTDAEYEAAAAAQLATVQESAEAVSFQTSNKIAQPSARYLLGVELTLAAIVAFSGMAKNRKAHNEKCDSHSEATINEEEDDDGNTAKATYFRRRTHLVSSFDTLQSIAESVYRNRAIAWLIADMNCASTKEEWIEGRRIVELRLRQTLELPSPEEAERFAMQLRKDFNTERLVTVVSDPRVDSDVLNKFLGSVTGLGQPQLIPG